MHGSATRDASHFQTSKRPCQHDVLPTLVDTRPPCNRLYTYSPACLHQHRVGSVSTMSGLPEGIGPMDATILEAVSVFSP